MREYQVKVVTDLDEIEYFIVTAASAQEAEYLATIMVENGETHLEGRHVINACAK